MIGDAGIDQKSEITLLGITLDDQLTYSSHISKVCRKASCQTGVLLRLRNLIPTSAKLHIVKFAIIPHLTYCQTVEICPGLNANEIQIPYDKHHKVSSLVKSHQNTHNSAKYEVM